MNRAVEKGIVARMASAATLYDTKSPKIAMLHGSIVRGLQMRGYLSRHATPALTDDGKTWLKSYCGDRAPEEQILRKPRGKQPMSHPLKAANFAVNGPKKQAEAPVEQKPEPAKATMSIAAFNRLKEIVSSPGEWVFLRAESSSAMSFFAFGLLAHVRAFVAVHKRKPTLEELVELSDQPHHIVAAWIDEIKLVHPDFSIPVAA